MAFSWPENNHFDNRTQNSQMGGKSSKKKQVEELEQPPPSARAQEYQIEEDVHQEDVYQQKSSGVG